MNSQKSDLFTDEAVCMRSYKLLLYVYLNLE